MVQRNLFTFQRKNYDETLKLLMVSQAYFKQYGRKEKALLAPADSLAYNAVMSNIIAKLTSVLSWLTLWRAVQEGEITFEEATGQEYGLHQFECDITQDTPVFSKLSGAIRQIMQDTSNLYDRVQHIDNRVRA